MIAERKRYRTNAIKKVFFVGGALLFAFFLVFGGVFYWEHLRGIWTAIKPPLDDISNVIHAPDTPLTLPKGFAIGVFAKNLGDPRVMKRDSLGNLLISIPSQGKILALPDKNADGVADKTVTILENLNRPHGIETRCISQVCQLYVAETDTVSVYQYEPALLKATNRKEIIALPSGGGHVTRTILLKQAKGKGLSSRYKDKLFISIGSSCNACDEKDSRRAKILVANSDGSDLKVFASGLRNAVFMSDHPSTGDIWATEMGRDLLGDNLPPDEINIIEEGKNYGWPICYGANVHDTDFDTNVYARDPCAQPFETPSFIDLPAHSAPLGLAFIPATAPWPQEYWHNLLVAYHGSWNRSQPTGYKIVRFRKPENPSLKPQDFIIGWLTNEGGAWGRPVDILALPRGILYISDDKAGVIYQVAYKEEGAIGHSKLLP